MGDKGIDRVKAQFKKMFPRLSARGVGLEDFRKCRKFMDGYVTVSLGRASVEEVDPLDFITREKEVRDELSRYAIEIYKVASTRSSQISLVRRLAAGELDLANAEAKNGDVTEEGAGVVVDPNKLKPHLRELWLQLPRVGGRKLKRGESREGLELSTHGKIFFKAILAVDIKFSPSSVKELIIDHYQYLKQEVARRVRRKFRSGFLNALCAFIKGKLKLKISKSRPRLSVDKLPPLLREELRLFEERAKSGIRAFPELERLAREWDFKPIEPLSPETIVKYRYNFLQAAAYFDLPEDVGVRDLLLLERRGNTREWFNRYVERFRSAERMVERPSKRLHYDSQNYDGCITAICAIARFNGIFDLQAEFQKYHAARLDRKGCDDRRRLKKAKMTRRWIDEEIDSLVIRFNEIIETKSFLVHREDLELCLFLPQCLTTRVLGYRQQCLRHCDQGKNIFFPKRGSVAFSYEKGEIKNEVPISQTFSVGEHGNLKLVKLLLEVLQDYKFKFLDVIKGLHPVEYQERMGEAFFGVPDSTEGGCGLKKNRIGDKDGDHLAYHRDEGHGRTSVRSFFIWAADNFMDTDKLIGTDFYLNPHFLRAVCVDWMRDDLEMTWEEIEEAIGDKEATLKRHYYTQKGRIQNASRAFARISRKNSMESKKGQEPSVYGNALNSLQESYKALTAQTVKAEERAARAEQRAAAAEEWAKRYEKGESYWRAVAEFAMCKAGLGPSDLPSELQVPAAA